MPGLTTGAVGLWGTVNGLSSKPGLSTPPGLLVEVTIQPGPPWIVLDAAGTAYLINTIVLSSSGAPYGVDHNVLSSTGVAYNPI